MLNIERILKQERLVRAMTGLNLREHLRMQGRTKTGINTDEV